MTFLPTYLSYKKGKPKNFPQTHHFILAKLLKFQETFHEKFLVSGFGASAPTFNTHKKARRRRAFYIVIICWNCRSKPPLQGTFEKVP